MILNFDTTVMREDNILSQLHASGKQIVFYGDDTWIRMFPKMFRRSEGTTSFFVTDYTEVCCFLTCLNLSLSIVFCAIYLPNTDTFDRLLS